ncbi:MAG: twin-arginine translocation signal domain-containing protein, partial [Comamonadaceae bacterium]
MMTRRDFVQTAAAAGATTALAGCAAVPAASTPLQWQHFPAGDKGFFRAPV